MKGVFEVAVRSKRVDYRFTVNRKFTLIRGDSATGKTTLYELLLAAEAGERSVSFTSTIPCVSANFLGGRWADSLTQTHESIVFIDEDSRWVNTQRFAEIAQASDNYYVIISRQRLPMIPYSVREIYKIRTSGRFHFLERLYESQSYEFTPDCLLVEDSGSGYQFFSTVCTNCISANGKSNIFSKLQDEASPEQNCLVIADGAAFNPEIERIVQLKGFLSRKIKVYLPESFEQKLLELPLFAHRKQVQAVLQNPAAYIDTRHNSWEQFFTAFLSEVTLGSPLQYSKASLSSCYMAPCCHRKTPCAFLCQGNKATALLESIPDTDFTKVRRL